MTDRSIEPYQSTDIVPAVEIFGEQLTNCLEMMGLPKDDILIPFSRRRPVFQNMPTVLEYLSEDQKSTSAYISKFVAACAVGLFDAALNYLWNETVKSLRQKVAQFDLVYFYDSVVSDTAQRSRLNTEADLEKIDDWELIKGCRITGIITDNGFRHLDYIRSMRNYASAAHPNQNEITGLQMVTYLETCIAEVLARDPEGPVLEVRRLLNNIRTEQLSDDFVPSIDNGLTLLPEDLADSLLRSVVGMYADVNVESRVRDNIRLLAQSIWDVVSDEARHEVGLKHATLATNGEVARSNLVREFIEVVDGIEFLPEPTISAEISAAVDNLMAVHSRSYNFYNEAAPARHLHRLVPESGNVPAAVSPKYIKALTMCRIGNGWGVSWAAQGCYDELIRRFSDHHIVQFIRLVQDPEVASRLQFEQCASNYQRIAGGLKDRAIRQRLKDMLEFIEDYDVDQLGDISSDRRYRRLRRSLRL